MFFAVFNTKPENDDKKKLPSCFFLISEFVLLVMFFFCWLLLKKLKREGGEEIFFVWWWVKFATSSIFQEKSQGTRFGEKHKNTKKEDFRPEQIHSKEIPFPSYICFLFFFQLGVETDYFKPHKKREEGRRTREKEPRIASDVSHRLRKNRKERKKNVLCFSLRLKTHFIFNCYFYY